MLKGGLTLPAIFLFNSNKLKASGQRACAAIVGINRYIKNVKSYPSGSLDNPAGKVVIACRACYG
jgi:hypothetical protein